MRKAVGKYSTILMLIIIPGPFLSFLKQRDLIIMNIGSKLECCSCLSRLTKMPSHKELIITTASLKMHQGAFRI